MNRLLFTQYKVADPDPYRALADAIITQAALDLFMLLAGFREPTNTINKEIILNFFKSEWFRLLTNEDPKAIVDLVRRTARQMKLEYTVASEKGSSRYYVVKAGDTTPLTPRFKTKKEALKKAADMQGIDFKMYMRIRRRDGIEE